MPIYLEISEDAPCCGVSRCIEILGEMGVPAAVDHHMEAKQWKFQVVSKRLVLFKRYKKEREYERVRFCGFQIAEDTSSSESHITGWWGGW